MQKAHTKTAKKSYGPDATEVTEDISDQELQEKIALYISENHVMSHSEVANLELNTRNQSTSGLWHKEHKKRLTSSNFGAVMSRKASTKNAPLVQRMMYPTFRGNKFTRHGLAMEAVTAKEYELKKAEEGKHVVVLSSGMVICHEQQQLGASVDGIVFNKSENSYGILEIKNVLKDKPITLKERVDKVPIFVWN
jgi:hypothetical protein